MGRLSASPLRVVIATGVGASGAAEQSSAAGLESHDAELATATPGAVDSSPNGKPSCTSDRIPDLERKTRCGGQEC